MKTSNNKARMRWGSGLLARLAAACILFGMIDAARSQPAKGLAVSISIFSGRPDPHYQVVDTKPLEEIRARLKRASASAKPQGDSAIPAILGYRGVVVENVGQVAGVPARVLVFNGVIEIETDSKTFLLDEGRAFEKYLVELALKQGAIDDKLYRKISARW